MKDAKTRPAVAADCVVFAADVEQGELKTLLAPRDLAPFEGRWALPGGCVRSGETLEAAAARALHDATGLRDVALEQLYAFGDPGRDPREHVVSVAYLVLVPLTDRAVRAAAAARRTAWFSTGDLPPLAFDHARIIAAGLRRLQAKVRREPLGAELLPAKFTLTQLQRIQEIVLDRDLDRRNFRKKALGLGVLEALDEVERGVSHRAARLFRFEPKRYAALRQQGISFEV